MVEANSKPVVTPRERAILAGLLVLALALRVLKLDAPLWFDEVMTLIHFVRQPFETLVADYSSFNNHLFYSLQAKLAVNAFGEAPWVLRLPAMLFGVASVWALWRLARTAMDAPQALVATALLALSYHHIWFSQNARGYTELLFWCLAALILFLEGWGTRSWRTWGLFGATLAAAMYTHLTAGFFIAALGLVYVALLGARLFAARSPQRLLTPPDPVAAWAPLGGFVFGGLLTLALCAPTLGQMGDLVGGASEGSEVDVMKEYQSPLWALAEVVRTLGGDNPIMMVAILGGLILVVAGAIGLWRRSPVIVATALLHVLVTLVALKLVGMRLWPRFFFTDIAFALLLAAQGAWVLAGLFGALGARLRIPFATPGVLFGLASAAMLLVSAGLAARNYAYPKQDYPAAVTRLACEGAPPVSVGAVGLASEVYDPYLHTGWRTVMTPADLAALTPHDGRRYAVMIFPSRTTRQYEPVWQVLKRDYQLIGLHPGTLGDGVVLVYASKAGPPLKCPAVPEDEID